MEKGAAGVEVEEGDLEEGPGAKEEILRLLLVAEMSWVCWTSAAQRQWCTHGGAELCSGRNKPRRPRVGFGASAVERKWGRRRAAANLKGGGPRASWGSVPWRRGAILGEKGGVRWCSGGERGR